MSQYNSMIVAIGSTNEAKVLALKEILANTQVISIAVSSDVADQPLSLHETIQGAKNRARNAFRHCDACSYAFGIESGLMEAPEVTTGFLHTSACAIYNGEQDFVGLATSFELPPQILELILEKKLDLTQACLASGISHNANIGSMEGLIGVLTKGQVDRKEYSKQCIRAALLQLENSNWYAKNVIYSKM